MVRNLVFLSSCNNVMSQNESVTVELTPLRVAISKRTSVEYTYYNEFPCFLLFNSW